MDNNQKIIINHELAEKQMGNILTFVLAILIAFTIIYFLFGGFMASAPEPEWWIEFEKIIRAMW